MPVEIVAYQAKSGDTYPDDLSVPDWVHKAILIRSDVPKNSRSRPDKWKYLSRSEVEELLGFSLKFLMSVVWNQKNAVPNENK